MAKRKGKKEDGGKVPGEAKVGGGGLKLRCGHRGCGRNGSTKKASKLVVTKAGKASGYTYNTYILTYSLYISI